MHSTLYELILNVSKTKTPQTLTSPSSLVNPWTFRLVNFPLEGFAMATEVAYSKAGTLVIMFPFSMH